MKTQQEIEHPEHSRIARTKNNTSNDAEHHKKPKKKKLAPVREQPKVEFKLDLDEDEALSAEEALAKVAIILAKTESPKLLSELDDYEIKLSAALFAASENIKMVDVMEEKMIQNFLLNFLMLRVSHKRQGRRELLEIAKSARDQPEQRFSKLRNIFGVGGK